MSGYVAEIYEPSDHGEIYRRTRCMFWNGKAYEPLRNIRYLRYNTGEWTTIGPLGDPIEYIEDARLIRALEKRMQEMREIKGCGLYKKERPWKISQK